METVELAISITEVARDEGLALIARIMGEDFISIVSAKSGATWGNISDYYEESKEARQVDVKEMMDFLKERQAMIERD